MFILFCRIAGAMLAFVTQVLLARWMGATELGVYVLAFSVCILLASISSLGLPSAALRFIGQALARKEYATISGYVRFCRQIGLAVGLLTAAGGAAVLALTSDANATTFLIAMLCVPVFALMRTHDGIAHAHSWMPLAFFPNSVVRPALLLLFVCGLWLTHTSLHASTVISLHLLILVLVGLAQTVLLNRRLRPIISDVTPSYDRALWTGASMPILVTVMMNAYLPEISVVLVGFTESADNVAIFNASFRVAFLIAFGTFAVDAVVMPRVARLYADGNISTVQTLISRATLLKVAGSTFGVALLFLFGRQILGLFGEEFVVGYWVMMILALSQLIIALLGPGAAILNATGHQNSCLRVFLVAFALLLVLNILLVPKLGLPGAAMAILIVISVRHVWLNMLVSKKTGIHPSLLAARNAFPSLATKTAG